MTEPLPEYKRTALEQQRSALLEEYTAAIEQLARTLSDVDRVRLERQLRDLEQRITKTKADLAALDPSSLVAGESGGDATAPRQIGASPADAGCTAEAVGCAALVVIAIIVAIVVWTSSRKSETSTGMPAISSTPTSSSTSGWFDNYLSAGGAENASTAASDSLGDWFATPDLPVAQLQFPATGDAPTLETSALQFIRYYYRIVIDKNVGLGWSLQTPRFQQRTTYRAYENWVLDKSHVDVTNLKFVGWSDGTAMVEADVTYYPIDGSRPTEIHHKFRLEFDPSRQTWLIDGS